MTSPDTSGADRLVDALTNLIPRLLHALDALGFVARYLYPPRLPDLLSDVGDLDRPLAEALADFNTIALPDHLTGFRTQIGTACEEIGRSYEGLRASLDDPAGLIAAYRALRHVSRAHEALYPVSYMLPPVSRFYLTETARQDAALLDKIEKAEPEPGRVGVLHARNEKKDRGGFSLYVPEYYAADTSWPLIVALHGGSGHGRDFLWSWLREARSAGALILSPTARGDTWSLMEPGIDTSNLLAMVDWIKERWSIDPSRILLTGMSDGGTFTYVCGLQAGMPFTHLAPVSASFHSFLTEMASPQRVRNLPVYLVHGSLDWMFPIDMAREARASLTDLEPRARRIL